MRDAGRGFDVNAIPADRLGIRGSIIARVTAVGGRSAVDSTPAGTTVTLGVERDGEPLDLEVVTGERDGGSQLGVFIDPEFDLPVDVTIHIERIGGPSAGLMFALGIVDRLTPEDEVAGILSSRMIFAVGPLMARPPMMGDTATTGAPLRRIASRKPGTASIVSMLR